MDIWHALTDADLYRENNVYQGLIEAVENGAELSLYQQSTSGNTLSIAVNSFSLLKSIWGLANPNLPLTETGVTLNEVVQFLEYKPTL